MDPLPPNVERRIAQLEGAQLVLVIEPRPAPSRSRATLLFHPKPPALALTVMVEGVRGGESAWPFAHAPIVRTGFRFSGPVRVVRFATVRSFAEGDDARSVRVEVELEGEAPIALEGSSVTLGPVPPPEPPKPAARPMYS